MCFSLKFIVLACFTLTFHRLSLFVTVIFFGHLPVTLPRSLYRCKYLIPIRLCIIRRLLSGNPFGFFCYQENESIVCFPNRCVCFSGIMCRAFYIVENQLIVRCFRMVGFLY